MYSVSKAIALYEKKRFTLNAVIVQKDDLQANGILSDMKRN